MIAQTIPQLVSSQSSLNDGHRIHLYEDTISVNNLLAAWREFVSGKRQKLDVQQFQANLMDNILTLHEDLKSSRYQHGGYEGFKVSDPKPRDIHKATVRDRFLHHAIYRVLYPFFDRTWIADSYSCRHRKGTHRSMDRLQVFFYRVSKNNTRTCYALKCDIRKFFASIDHETLITVVRKHLKDGRFVSLIENVVKSFGPGLPLGNLTSQLLVNVYMNEFDQFAKHNLKAKYYIRYADDFVILSTDRKWLEDLITQISAFLKDRLKLSLHPDKVYIKTIASGLDFLGWVHFPDHRVLRPASRRRMFRNLKAGRSPTRIQSYLGLLTHGNAHKLQAEVTRFAV